MAIFAPPPFISETPQPISLKGKTILRPEVSAYATFILSLTTWVVESNSQFAYVFLPLSFSRLFTSSTDRRLANGTNHCAGSAT